MVAFVVGFSTVLTHALLAHQQNMVTRLVSKYWLQCGAPKIAKLVDNSNNYMVYGTQINRTSYWGFC